MAVVRELLTVLGFDLDDQAVKGAADAFFSLKAKAEALRVVFDASIGTLAQYVNETITGAQETEKWAKALGVTTQELEELNFASERFGADSEDVADFLKELAIRANDAKDGSEDMANAFRRLGVRITDANGKVRPSIDLFNEVADGIEKTQNAAERTFLVDTLGSDAGTRLLPLLLKGSKGIAGLREEARALGFVLDKETIEASNRLTRQFQILDKIFLGIRRRIGAQLLPLVEEFTTRLIDLLVANRKLIDRGIKLLIDSIGGFIRTTQEAIRIIDQYSVFFSAFAFVLSARAIPAVLGLAKSFGALFIAQIRALAIPVLMSAAFIALAFVIALVIEDIWHFVTGGESALEELFDFFTEEAQKPGAHWIVKTIAFILWIIKEAIEAVDLFFREFFEDAERLGGIWEALKAAGGLAIDYWLGKLRSFFSFLFQQVDRLGGIKTFLKILSNPALAAGEFLIEKGRQAITGLPPGVVGVEPLPAEAGAGAGGGGISVGGSSVSITVEGTGSASAAEIVGEARRQFEQATQDERRATLRELQTQVLR